MRTLLPALALLIFAACDSAPAPLGELTENAFSLQLGDGPVETRAEAHFGSYISDANGATFAMVLGARPVSTPLSLAAPAVGFAYDGAAVSPGTYALEAVDPAGGDPPKEAFIGVYIDPARTLAGVPGRAGFYYTGQGTITIDSLSADRAQGSFAMTAIEYGADLQPSGSEVEVTGAFHAIRTEAFGDEDAFWR